MILFFNDVNDEKMVFTLTDRETIKFVAEMKIDDFSNDVLNFFARLEECFGKYPNGFPRHCEPRKDQNNLHGLSWMEELNRTKYFVKKAFKKIGVHYKSREEYEQAEDKFQGKYYCSVYDAPNHHRTFYYRNNELFATLAEQWLTGTGLNISDANLNMAVAE